MVDITNTTEQSSGGRFIDALITDKLLQFDVIHGFDGRKLRANRLVQTTDGMSHAISGIDHTMVFHIAGGAAERYQGKKRTGISETLKRSTLIPAHTDASWLMPDSVDVLHLYIDDADLRQFAETEYGFDPNLLEMRDHMGVDDNFMSHLAPLMLHELKSDLPQTRLMLDGFDSVVAGHLLRAYSNMSDVVLIRYEKEQDQRDHDAVRRARNILSDRFDENVSARDVAREVNIEPFRLMRAFKREIGVTMHQYVLQLRVEFVKTKLRDPSEQMVNIAFDAGFSSQPHMISSFKTQTGVTPGRYRKIVAG